MTQTIDHGEVLRASEKFRQWRRHPHKSNRSMLMGEKHFSPSELAKLWGVSAETIRVLFRQEQGVLKIGQNGTRYKRGYKTLRIPESVAERVHTRLSA